MSTAIRGPGTLSSAISQGRLVGALIYTYLAVDPIAGSSSNGTGPCMGKSATMIAPVAGIPGPDELDPDVEANRSAASVARQSGWTILMECQ